MNNIPELNEAFTLSKSIKAILIKLSNELDDEENDSALALYGLITLSENVIRCQEKTIEYLSTCKTK